MFKFIFINYSNISFLVCQSIYLAAVRSDFPFLERAIGGDFAERANTNSR